MTQPDTPQPTRDADSVTSTREPGESVAHSVVRAVAAVTDTDPVSVPPLYDTLDPDALNRTVESFAESSRAADTARVSFRFHGCRVTVFADDRTVVTPPATDGD